MQVQMSLRVGLASLLCLILPAISRGEEIHVANDSELIAAVRAAKPGQQILLAPGNYRGDISAGSPQGTADAPIVIAAADAAEPPVISGGSVGLFASSPQYFELHNLVFENARDNGLNIDDSGSVDKPSRGLVLQGLVVRKVGAKGNRDGIKLSGVDDFKISNCQVESWGASGSAIDMVGCHRGVIEGCKFTGDRSSNSVGVQAKGGCSQIAVRRCRFEDVGGRGVNLGGSTGLPFFRPKDANYEAKDITVEDCEFIGGDAAVAFVGVDGALVQHNTIYRPGRWVLRILQENTAPRFVASRNGRFLKNAVVLRADEVRQVANVGGDTKPESFEFAGNVWHCLDAADSRRLVQLPTAETDGVYNRRLELADPEQGDLSIKNRTDDDAGVRAATAE
jgi:hypothetical protein